MAVAVDTLSRVLFHSNGCEIRGAHGEVLENDTGLNPGALHEWACGVVGYTLPRSMTALPLPVPTMRTLPHFPNFRLYDVDKSPCDTLGIDGTSSTTAPPADAFTVHFVPNPFHEHLTIQATEGGQLRIWRVDGSLVLSQVLQPGQQQLSTAPLGRRRVCVAGLLRLRKTHGRKNCKGQEVRRG